MEMLALMHIDLLLVKNSKIKKDLKKYQNMCYNINRSSDIIKKQRIQGPDGMEQKETNSRKE